MTPAQREWVSAVINAKTRDLAATEIKQAIGTMGEQLLSRADMTNMVAKVVEGPNKKVLRQKAMEVIKKEAAVLLAAIGQMKKEEGL